MATLRKVTLSTRPAAGFAAPQKVSTGSGGIVRPKIVNKRLARTAAAIG